MKVRKTAVNTPLPLASEPLRVDAQLQGDIIVLVNHHVVNRPGVAGAVL